MSLLPKLPMATASFGLRMMRTKPTMMTTSTASPSGATQLYWLLPPSMVSAATPRMGRPRLTKMLQSPTAVMAAVADVPEIRYDVSMAYCTARPKAPPAGTPLDMANAA